jgi:hypothetical protein
MSGVINASGFSSESAFTPFVKYSRGSRVLVSAITTLRRNIAPLKVMNVPMLPHNASSICPAVHGSRSVKEIARRRPDERERKNFYFTEYPTCLPAPTLLSPHRSMPDHTRGMASSMPPLVAPRPRGHGFGREAEASGDRTVAPLRWGRSTLDTAERERERERERDERERETRTRRQQDPRTQDTPQSSCTMVSVTFSTVSASNVSHGVMASALA